VYKITAPLASVYGSQIWTVVGKKKERKRKKEKKKKERERDYNLIFSPHPLFPVQWLLRMLNYTLTEATFRDGLRKFLQEKYVLFSLSKISSLQFHKYLLA
jgi:hypothetical protein